MKFFLAIMVAVTVAFTIYILGPFTSYKEVRKGNKIREIKVVYVNVTGESLCAKLYTFEGDDITKTRTPIFPALPSNMLSPEDTNAAYHDNIFYLKGYDYFYVKENVLTGEKEEKDSYRFDVISWEAHVPYKVWSGDTSDEGIMVSETSSKPIKFVYSGDDEGQHFKKANYVDCLG